ncbi:MAG: aminoacyl-tRNA hydrolase [Saprospiraceae bacterium]|nr:aminoacyl-tRNA hydrolase [Saprospiraceae bacterium]
MSEEIHITSDLSISASEISWKAIRSGGPGGQHVNKVSTAVQLSFDILQSSLPNEIKTRAISEPDHRVSKEGVLTLRVSKHRSQLLNKREAIDRLTEWLHRFVEPPKKRHSTRPSRSSKEERIKKKRILSERKRLRRPPTLD